MHRGSQHLLDFSRDYPGIYRTMDQLGIARGFALPRLAPWFFLFLARAYVIPGGGRDSMVPFRHTGQISRIRARAAWSHIQRIYRFLAAVFDAVWLPLT
ncbi:MAG: hypothetical protein AB1733_02520 [Thermodesulfobacteriota bacterium]